MKGHAALWDVDERYARLSAAGDPLERLNTVVAWEMFRKPLTKALNRPDRAQGGRPPYDAVMMFKILVLQALYGLSDEQAEFQIMTYPETTISLGRIARRLMLRRGAAPWPK